jgi:hypothetical protein
MEAGDLPQGASPFCQDMDFELGATFTRAFLTATFAGQVSGNINYLKTFTLPAGNKQLLVLDSAGNFYYEDTTNNPGVLNKIGTVIPGSFAHSVTAFGREYIAFHDHTKGTDIPRQWDGVNFDRVTQDGAGISPAVTATLASIGITSITQAAAVTGLKEYRWSAGPNSRVSGSLITVFYARVSSGPADPNIVVGAWVNLAGFNTVDGLNPDGLYPIISIQTVALGGGETYSFTVQAASSSNQDGTPPPDASYQCTLATLTLAAPSSTVSVGGQISISGASPGGWNGTWTITALPITSGMNITNTSLTADVATFTYTLQLNPLNNTLYGQPSAGQLVTVVNSINGGGIFNVVNAMIASVTPVGSGGTFTVNLTEPNVNPAPDSATATVQGTEVQFDPGPLAFAGTIPAAIIGNDTGEGTIAVPGLMAGGTRQCTVLFETRQGALLKASPPVTFFLSNSTGAITVSGIPTGPSNIVARWLCFTGANGDFFFAIPVPVSTTVAGVTTTSSATVINDNVTTEVVLSFTDAALLSATAVDQPGANQFAVDTLGPCMGFNLYADRLFAWGELNAVQDFLNMDFDGGFDSSDTYPLGWTIDPVNGAGGGMATTALWGNAYGIVGDGATAIRGMITQPAAVDWEMEPILESNTQYSVRVRLLAVGAPTQGNAVIELYSPSQGSLGTFVIPVSQIGTSQFSFNSGILGMVPSVIPNDLILRIYASGTLPNGTQIFFDEPALYPTAEPVINSAVRASYVLNPEGFDGVTGFLGVDGLGSRPVTATFELRDTFYVTGFPGLFATNDNGQEPDTWDVPTISDIVGSCSVDGVAEGEDWFTLSNGLKGEFIFNGSLPIKISQEIQPDFDILTPSAVNTTWKFNDITNRRMFIGVPINGATSPNVVYMMRYTELNSSFEVAEQKPVHISYSGRMVAWDMSRKWCPWNIVAPCGAVVDRQNGAQQVFFGNGLNTNKAYFLDPTNLVGDDGSFVNSIYFPFFFVNRDMEQMMQMGLGRKYYDYLRMFVAGAGVLNTTAQSDSMTSPRIKTLAPRTLTINPGADREIGVNWEGDRTSFGVQTAALGAWFRLSKMVITMRQSSWMPKRGIG